MSDRITTAHLELEASHINSTMEALGLDTRVELGSSYGYRTLDLVPADNPRHVMIERLESGTGREVYGYLSGMLSALYQVERQREGAAR